MRDLALVVSDYPEKAQAYQAAFRVRLPTLDELARKWTRAEALLRSATARSGGCFEPIDVLRLAMAGQMGVWFIEADGRLVACAATQVRAYPRKRILEVVFIGGSGVFGWHRPLLAALDAHARAQGCDAVMGSGRSGWTRFGFENRGAVMVRDLPQ